MAFQYNPNIWLYIGSIGLLSFLMAYTFRKRIADRLSLATQAMVALWSLGFALQISVTDLRMAFLSYVAANDFIGLKVPMVWLLWAITVSGKTKWLTRPRIVLLFTLPVLTDLLNLTNPWHGLMYRQLQMVAEGPYRVLKFDPGPWYWVIFIYCSMVLLAVMAVQTRAAIKRELLHPKQAFGVALATGGVLVVIILIVSKTLFFPDITPVAISLAIAYTIMNSRFRRQEAVPVPRNAVLEKMANAVIILDNRNRIMDLNPAAEAFLGVRIGDVAGDNLREVLRVCPELAEDTTTMHREFSHGDRTYEAYFSDLHEGYRRVGRLLIIRDVTSYKEVEAKMAHQHQALLVLKERERLARELHDSVGQVLSYTNLQMQNIKAILRNGSVSEVEEILNRMAQVIEEANQEIREFIYETRTTLLFKKGFFCALGEYLSRFEKNYRIKVIVEKPELIREEDIDLAVGVQLYRIIQEALANVRKHAQTDRVLIAFQKQENQLRVEVIDHGIGFDPKRLEAGKSSFGLTVMGERAEQVGGRVRIESAPGAGTTVTITLPLGQGPRRENDCPGQERESTPPETRTKLRILLADDHALFMEGLQKLLTAKGFDVVGQARDGLEALEKARLLHPDMILMDLQMPRCNGLTATRLIKAEMPEIKIIILTFSDHEADLFRAIKNGASGYLLKSLQGDELSKQLIGLATGATVLTPEIAAQVLAEFNDQEGQTAVAVEEDPPNPEMALTDRQREILALVAQGKTYKEVGARLFISERTVKYEMAAIIKKLHCQTRQQAIAYAQKKMGIEPENG